MDKPEFVYVLYISSTAETVWNALIDVKVTPRFWHYRNVSDWKPGSRWEHQDPESGSALLVGKVLEFSPPRRLVLSWAEPADEAHEDGHSRVTFEIEPVKDIVRLTVVHDRLERDSRLFSDIADGWPKVLSSLKSFLETGRSLPRLR